MKKKFWQIVTLHKKTGHQVFKIELTSVKNKVPLRDLKISA